MSGAHAPGPACSGIRKTVQFPLQPGRYVIQLFGQWRSDHQCDGLARAVRRAFLLLLFLAGAAQGQTVFDWHLPPGVTPPPVPAGQCHVGRQGGSGPPAFL